MSRSSPPIAFVIGALALAQAICWGVTFNLSAITGVAMAASLGLPYVTIMAGPTVMLVVMALVAVPFLQLFERFGARRVMTASTGIGALGLTLVALSTGAVPYFLGWLVVGIAGAGMLTTAVQIALAERAGPGARQAIGALMVFGGLSTALCWPLLGLVQAAYGWRGATLAGAAALLILAAPIYWWLLVPRPVREAAPVPSAAAAPLDWTAFGLLAFAMAANGIVTWGFSLTVITLLEGRGLDHATAIFAASFVGIAAFCARLIDVATSRRWNSLVTGLLAGIGLPVSFAILMLGTGTVAAAAFVALYGLSSGILAVARSTLPLDLFPASAYARASSMLALPLNLSFACAPPLFAGLLAGPGSAAALGLAAALSLAALGALLLLTLRHRHGAGSEKSRPTPR